jgi:hypothetical protein
MKRHGDLWNKIIDIDNITLAYKRARKNKGYLRGVKRFEKDEDAGILKIHYMLKDKVFTTSKYHRKLAHYPKFREIFVVPFFPDRIVQHALMAVVEPIWDKVLSKNTVSCRKKRGVEAAFRLATTYTKRNTYCLKCDISRFYPSINHNILYSLIQRKIKCPDTLWLIKDIIYSFGGEANSPIGNYTSQWFGNLYLDIIDKLATQVWKVDYVRYCDDFIFFSNNKFILQKIMSILPKLLWEERKLTLSKLDLFKLNRGLDFVGYRFFNEYTLIRKRVAKILNRRIKRIANRIENGIINDRIRSQLASAIGLLKRCDSYNFKKNLNFSKLIEVTGIKTKYK